MNIPCSLIGWAATSVCFNLWLKIGFGGSAGPTPLLHANKWWFDKAIKTNFRVLIIIIRVF